ncbi:site-2 protease family protein [Pelistega sp. NLN82]|uniref:Site-2 protease family protein n=1 Tax=Pelistega ratti TaxID=2652177 RepID=A0A6L9Y510_9BURK|nr:site-2 protease family protein [Pelistega ratti]NEN75562.1 site-2 protease family protein [Pelistega ratti]
MSFEQILFYISVYIPPLLFAIALHEAAHGYMARYFGDNTAYMLGRLSLNPTKHIDPIGTIILPAVLILLKSPFIFGWAKPVPVVTRNLRNPKQDMIFVALAGPGANLVMALLWVVLLKIWVILDIQSEVLITMALFGIRINLLLMLFNLIPVPPLDGGRILVGLLPIKFSLMLSRVEPYGIMIVFALILLTDLSNLLGMSIYYLQKGILQLFGF